MKLNILRKTFFNIQRPNVFVVWDIMFFSLSTMEVIKTKQPEENHY